MPSEPCCSLTGSHKYRTKLKDDQKPALGKFAFLSAEQAAARKLFRTLEPIAQGVFLTRDLVSEPANVLYPESFAAKAKELTKLGLEVQVLGEKEMSKLGMGSLLSVGRGVEPRLATVGHGVEKALRKLRTKPRSPLWGRV